MVQAYLFYNYPGLVGGRTMRSLQSRLSDPKDKILKLCGFAERPSYSTFRRDFHQLDVHPELVEPVLKVLSDLLKSRPWAKRGEKGSKKAESCEDGKRRKDLAMSDKEFNAIFPDDAAAEQWFAKQRWPDGYPRCPQCGSDNVQIIESRKPQPYRCKNSKCNRDHFYFSVKIGTVMQGSNVKYRDWALAIYRMLKGRGISAPELGDALKISPQSAWHLIHRIQVCLLEEPPLFDGEIQVDETPLGGLEKYKHEDKKLHSGGGSVGKIIIIGALHPQSHRVWIEQIEVADCATCSRFLRKIAKRGTGVYTDGNAGYRSIARILHEFVTHSKGEYVRGDVTTNGIDSIWHKTKRELYGTYGHLGEKYLHLYLAEVMWRYNHGRERDEEQMEQIARNMVGRRLPVEAMRAATSEGLRILTEVPEREPKSVQLKFF